MRIEIKEFELYVSESELSTIAFDMRRSILASIKDHWINHQDAFEKNESQRLSILKRFSQAMQNEDFYDEIIRTAEKEFKKYNDKNGDSK